MRNEKLIISNTDNFFCFNINAFNVYTNDIIIYKIKIMSWEQFCLWTSSPNFPIYTIEQSLKIFHKKNCKNIGLYQLPITDTRGHHYNSIVGGIIVQVRVWLFLF
jgi:hypothetical protein